MNLKSKIMPTPVTVQTRPIFKMYLWIVTILLFLAFVGIFIRMLDWIPFMSQEPTLIALILPVLLLFAMSLWMGRWALFHATVAVTVNEKGVAMKSLIANDSISWPDIEAIHLQGTSGSEVQLIGNNHRVTFPSGSAAPPKTTLHIQEWLTYALNERDLDYRSQHFWGP